MTSNPGEPLVYTRGLTKRFGDRVSVNQLDLEIHKGQIFGFLGPNGAGKTTTIRLLLGLMTPTAGEVRLFGRSLRTDRVAILRRVGALVESPSYYRNLTGYENLKLSATILGVPDSRIREVLEIVRLTEAAHRPVKQYSLGMKQRLGIALALLGSPELLILDEPTNGLDPAGIHEIRELIKRFPAEYGITVMISSHNLGEIEMIATHVGIIQAGHLVFQGTIDELRQRSQPVLEIGVDDPDRAFRMIADEGYSVEARGNLLLLPGAAAFAARINEQLVRSGVRVSHLYARARTLEEMFLEMTGGEGGL